MFMIERDGYQTIVRVWENLDIASREPFERVLEAATANRPRRLIVSLEHCDFCDSTGLHVLLQTQRRIGSRLTVVVPPENKSRRIFEVCGFPRLMTIVASMREALAPSARESARKTAEPIFHQV
jgi:anti-anti-sigma factor